MCDELTPFIIFLIVDLIIGITCWSVSAARPDYYTSDFLTALPLFPSDTYGFGPYYAQESASKTEPFSFSIEHSSVIPENKRSYQFQIIHNLYNFTLNGKFFADDNEVRGFSITNSTYNLTFENIDDLLPSDFFSYKKYLRISCPFKIDSPEDKL